RLTATGAVALGHLTAGYLDERAWYGVSLALSSGWLAVGAPLEDRAGQFGFPEAAGDTDSRDDTGTVYLYARSGDAFVPANPIIGVSREGMLGASLAISGDRLAAGSPSVTGPASVQLYPLGITDAAPVVEATLMPNDPNAYLFGFSVALSSDTLIVGAPFTGGKADGAA